MSGHSHYATIKRKKEVSDAARGKVFSKHVRAIAVAIKVGGGPDPNINSRLRFAIEQAKADNMPKSNVDRALNKASEVGNLEEMTYEGYGPEGVGVVVTTATDKRNRTTQEIKNIFEKGGGSLSGPGAVSYNFEPKGFLVVKKTNDPDSQMLSLIDLGVEDVEETDDAIEVFVAPDETTNVKEELENNGFKVISFKLIQKPKTLVTISNPQKAKQLLKFLETLEDQEDVQDVFANIDIPESAMEQL
jgi:YebC/PmpR family DNA-binding regulatory protein